MSTNVVPFVPKPSQTTRQARGRRPNAALRVREYLLPEEVEALITAAATVGRHRQRDATLLLIMYRRALRVSEAVALTWAQLDVDDGWIHINRLKGGVATAQPLSKPELSALRLLRHRYPNAEYLFPSERGTHLTRGAVNQIVTRVARIADLEIKAHPHMLRHAAGYALVNQGHDLRKIQHLMGHARISTTVGYTMLDQNRLRGIWDGNDA